MMAMVAIQGEFKDVFDLCPSFKLDPSRFFWTSKSLDVTIVSLGDQVDNKAEKDFKLPDPLPLTSTAQSSVYLNIIGHPKGVSKKYSFRGFQRK
jgi:histidinol phosphatase-like PHP family hydrolase